MMFERTRDTLQVLENSEKVTITGSLDLFHDICADVKDSEDVSIGKLPPGDEDEFVLSVCRAGRVLLNIIKNQKGTIETAENLNNIEAVETKLAEAQKQLEAVKEKIELTKDKKQELELKRSVYQKEYATYEQQLEQEQRLQAECQALKQKIEESASLDTEKLMMLKQQLESQLNQCEAECSELVEENKKLEFKLEAARDRLRTEQVHKQNMNAELTETIKNYEACNLASDVLEKDKAEKEKEILVLQEQCEAKQAQLEKLRQETLPELQQKINEIDIKLTYQEEEFKKKKMHYDALLSEFSEKEAEQNSWIHIVEEKESEVNQIVSRIEREKKRAEELDNEVKNLGAEQKNLLERIDASQNAINARDITSLKSLCTEKEKEAGEVQQKYNELDRRIQQLEQSISEGKNTLEVQNGLANNKQIECEALKEKINKEEERKKQLDNEYEKLADWLKSLQLDKYKDEVANCKIQVEIMETARANFKAYIWDLPTSEGYVLEEDKCVRANKYFEEELGRISHSLKTYTGFYNELMNLYKKV